jgi:methylase of polypeptide subunit release factors
MLTLDEGLIAGLRALLADLRYDAVQRSLRGNYFVWPFPTFDQFQTLIAGLPDRQRVSYEVLLLGQTARQERVERAWGSAATAGLLELGLLEPAANGRVRTANWSIVSYFGRYFVVSLNPYYPGSRDPDTAVYMGGDSLTLAMQVLDQMEPAQRALDLCAGSGIQAILAAATAQEVAAVELNEQAAHLARFNALLNGVAGRVGVYQGNLYDAAPAGPYDLIVSNPPFIPVPDGVPFAMCGAGGEDGLTVLRSILEGLPGRLSPEGRAIIYAEGPGDREGPFVRRLLAELATREGLEVQLMATSALTTRSALILRAVSLEKLKRNVPAELAQWKSLYERLGATHLYNYILRIRRGAAGRLTQIMAFDPHREERGIEVQPGVIVKPK